MSSDVAESNAVERTDGDTENTQVHFNCYFIAIWRHFLLIDLRKIWRNYFKVH